MYRITLPCSQQFAVRFQAMPDLIQHHFGGMPPLMDHPVHSIGSAICGFPDVQPVFLDFPAY
jgi:hypothetical protein